MELKKHGNLPTMFLNEATGELNAWAGPGRVDSSTEKLVLHNPDSKPNVNSDALEKSISAVSFSNDVVQLVIDRSSSIKFPWLVSNFPNLRELHILGQRIESLKGLESWKNPDFLFLECPSKRKIDTLLRIRLPRLSLKMTCEDDLKIINEMQSLSSLTVSSWISKSLLGLRSPNLIQLILILGRVVEVGTLAKLRYSCFGRCSKLCNLAGLRTENLSIDACNRVHLDSIGDVAGLKKLELVSQKSVDSFEFVRRCKDLEAIVVASKITAESLEPLFEGEKLKSIYLPTRDSKKRAIICNISKRFPKISIWTPGQAFRAGEVIDEKWTGLFSYKDLSVKN